MWHSTINKPISFELDKRAIVDLLIGQALYSRQDVAVRELLQNSIDTCNYRLAVEKDYKPKIEIEFDKDHITFRDNGMGMNFEDALEYFSKKGCSLYISDAFKDATKGKKIIAIGKFGIGVLSSFLIADQMIINTKKYNCSPCKFSIADLVEGWTYEQGGKEEQGTDITLYLNETGNQVDVLESCMHYAKSVNFPILITNLNTGYKGVLTQTWDYWIPEIYEKVSSYKKEKFVKSKPKFTLEEDFQDFDIKIYIYQDHLFLSNENCFILNQGVYIGSFDLFPTRISKIIILLNLKSDIVNLTVSRDNLVHDEKFNKFLEIFYNSLIDVFENYIEKKYSVNSVKEKIEKLSLLFGDLFHGYSFVPKSSPKSIMHTILVERQKYISLTTEGMSIITFNELINAKVSKIFHYGLESIHYKVNIKMATREFNRILKPNEIVIFDLGPKLFFNDPPEENICSFCEVLQSKGMKSIECWDLSTLISFIEFPEIDTPIKTLLPAGSYFSNMPNTLRGFVFEKKSFELSSSVNSNTDFEGEYYYMVAIHLLSSDKELAQCYEDSAFPYDKNIIIKSEGNFVFDANDPFIEFLISKQDRIFTDPLLQKLCERYFKFLAIYFISNERSTERIVITNIEKTLASLLDYPREYIELNKRAGALTLIEERI